MFFNKYLFLKHYCNFTVKLLSYPKQHYLKRFSGWLNRIYTLILDSGYWIVDIG